MTNSKKQSYIALLRGINVGGHKKVPMAELSQLMGNAGFENVETLLNSGNVIFKYLPESNANIESKLSELLQNHFGFSIPVLIRKAEELESIIKSTPFESIELNKDIRLYVTFLKEKTDNNLIIPWVSEDQSFRIIKDFDKAICSVLDLSKSKTVKAMGMLEKNFGKDITTRNWNTLLKIKSKIK